MKKTNAKIYGPPAHSLTAVTMKLERTDHGWAVKKVTGSSETHRGSIWVLEDHAEFDGNDAMALNLAQSCYVLTHDLIRDLPSTQERAQWVASGGLYEQLVMRF